MRAIITAPTEKERYVSVLDAADALSITLGVVSAAWLRRAQPDSKDLAALREAYDRGVTQGTWQSVVRAASQQPLAQEQVPGLHQAAVRSKKGSLLQHLGLLTQERNHWAHGAAPRTNADAAERLANMQPTLDAAVSRAAFLARIPWVVVQSCSYRANEQNFEIRTNLAMGDHPEFTRSAIISSVPLADERVYLVLRDQQPLDLTPFVVWRHCAECRKAELFFVDRCPAGSSGAVLKSFDGGHKMTDPDLVPEISRLGHRV
jgi:hypothetical protein